jgi:predicted negative regulator of RcsB-dependent stress response
VRGKQIVITALIAAAVVVGFSVYQKRAAGVTGR